VNGLLSRVLDAHGGLEDWNRIKRIQATIVTTGALWGMKGLEHEAHACRVDVWRREQRVTLGPSSGSDLHCEYTPDRVAIVDSQGVVIAERDTPRASFAGHVKLTRWDPLHLAYFEGCALWTLFSVPFLLASTGVEVTELEPWSIDGETIRVLRARFPDSIATHSSVQRFFFGEDFLLRRQDGQIEIAGGMNVCYHPSEYVETDRIHLATRGHAYISAPELNLVAEPPLVTVELSEVGFA
jgi:hypothetical protein